MNNLLELNPIKRLVRAVGQDIVAYFGKDPACIIYLQPDGTFYGVALYEWLKKYKNKKNLTLTTMEDDGNGLEEAKVRGRKVLIVDNDIVTGKGFKRSTEALRLRRERLNIRDIKFAVFSDRVGLADFSVAEYSAGAVWSLEDLDAIDLKIISYLAQDGRMSFADIGKKLKITGVAAKKRVDRLFERKVITIQGVITPEHFYTLSASAQIDAERKAIDSLVERCKKIQEVYHLTKRTGSYNLVIGILGRSVADIEEFLEREIRSVPGVRSIDVRIGELPIIPKTIAMKANTYQSS